MIINDLPKKLPLWKDILPILRESDPNWENKLKDTGRECTILLDEIYRWLNENK